MNIHRWKRLHLRLRFYGVVAACWIFTCPMPATGAANADSTRVNGTRLAIVLGTVAGAATAIQIYQENAWWRNYRSSFHFLEELEYARNLDKLGHLYGAALLTNVFARSFEWANVSRGRSLYGGRLGLHCSRLTLRFGTDSRNGVLTPAWISAADLVGAWYPVPSTMKSRFSEVSVSLFSYRPKNCRRSGVRTPGRPTIFFDDLRRADYLAQSDDEESSAEVRIQLVARFSLTLWRDNLPNRYRRVNAFGTGSGT